MRGIVRWGLIIPFWPIFHLSGYIWHIFHLCHDLVCVSIYNTENIISSDPHSCNVKEALAMLENMCKQLRKHISTAQMQSKAHVQERDNLYYETFISIEESCVQWKSNFISVFSK